jgi:hypothetical protein
MDDQDGLLSRIHRIGWIDRMDSLDIKNAFT